MQILTIFALSMGFLCVLGENCCQQKTVGGKSYTLITGEGDTSQYGCQDKCVYRDDNDEKFCFKAGGEQSECKDGSNASTRYFFNMPSIWFDIPPVGQQSSEARQSSTEVTVNSHKKGYSTSNGACATASLGVKANITIDIKITATTEKSIDAIGVNISSHLKESVREEFNEQFNTRYSLDVGLDWLGISSSGDYQESSHEDAWEEGEESFESARKEFTEALKEQNSKEVHIVGEATVEGRTPIPTEYCLFYAVEKVEFSDGNEVFVVNDHPSSGKTGTSDGAEVPNDSSKLSVLEV